MKLLYSVIYSNHLVHLVDDQVSFYLVSVVVFFNFHILNWQNC